MAGNEASKLSDDKWNYPNNKETINLVIKKQFVSNYQNGTLSSNNHLLFKFSNPSNISLPSNQTVILNYVKIQYAGRNFLDFKSDYDYDNYYISDKLGGLSLYGLENIPSISIKNVEVSNSYTYGFHKRGIYNFKKLFFYSQ